MWAAGFAAVLLDQISKQWATSRATGRARIHARVLRIERIAHRHTAYETASSRAVFVVLWAAALAASMGLHDAAGWFQPSVAQVGLGLALGGAAGNLIDMLRLRYVVDFIGVRWCGVFNLADVAIVAGLAMALWPHP
jgi:signal peptidase II